MLKKLHFSHATSTASRPKQQCYIVVDNYKNKRYNTIIMNGKTEDFPLKSEMYDPKKDPAETAFMRESAIIMARKQMAMALNMTVSADRLRYGKGKTAELIMPTGDVGEPIPVGMVVRVTGITDQKGKPRVAEGFINAEGHFSRFGREIPREVKDRFTRIGELLGPLESPRREFRGAAQPGIPLITSVVSPEFPYTGTDAEKLLGKLSATEPTVAIPTQEIKVEPLPTAHIESGRAKHHIPEQRTRFMARVANLAAVIPNSHGRHSQRSHR